ncbi:uncharacterized protein G2W53_029016 [Senna tora]|uniref:Uncharacterized protein n=1 Tax=Senna tora TaxID=362788 RepID=A0A834WAA8_9FABA|nr:uncharacterized protein G2W53_029016 [Senna tora]
MTNVTGLTAARGAKLAAVKKPLMTWQTTEDACNLNGDLNEDSVIQ